VLGTVSAIDAWCGKLVRTGATTRARAHNRKESAANRGHKAQDEKEGGKRRDAGTAQNERPGEKSRVTLVVRIVSKGKKKTSQEMKAKRIDTDRACQNRGSYLDAEK